MLTQAELKTILSYNLETGKFTWLNCADENRNGNEAGTVNKHGYVKIKINQKLYSAHRLAFLYVYGTFPALCVDHKNTIRNDNRWANLRPATQQENQFNRNKQKNNASGFKGVFWYTSKKRWVARICISGKTKHIGSFINIDDAVKAYNAYAKMKHGDFYKGDM